MNPFLGFLGWGGDRLPQASGIATRVDGLIFGLLVAGLIVVTILGALTTFILIRYRKGTVADRSPVGIATWKIESGWTVVTLGVFLYFFWRGASLYLDMELAPAGADAIHVVARQWMWDMRYSDGRREFNVLHLRVNMPVRIVLSSEDVIHSFFVPAFRMKQDAVPGRVVSCWVTPTRPGTYSIFCAQYCGTAHAEMTGTVVVMGPSDFDAWKRGVGPREAIDASSPISLGRMVYVKYGCGRCHDDPASSRAPSLAGLFGQRVGLEGGGFVRADEQYLHDAVLLAPKYVVAGYTPVMPTYAGIVSEREATDLISYIETLRSPDVSLASLR